MHSILEMPWTTSSPLVRTVGADSQKRRRLTLLLRGDSDQICTIDERSLDQCKSTRHSRLNLISRRHPHHNVIFSFRRLFSEIACALKVINCAFK